MAFIGKLLRTVRSGDAKLAIKDPACANAAALTVRSSAFADGGPMSAPYVGIKGDFPPIAWSDEPSGTQSFAIVVQDVDVPFPAPLIHAVAYGIAVGTHGLPPAALPRAASKQQAAPGIEMGSGFAGTAYGPPTPIPGHGPHRYVYQVFALDNMLQFAKPPGKTELLQAMAGHVLACGAVTGTYEVT